MKITLELNGKPDALRSFLAAGIGAIDCESAPRQDADLAAEVLEAAVKDGTVALTVAFSRVLLSAPSPRFPALEVADTCS